MEQAKEAMDETHIIVGKRLQIVHNMGPLSFPDKCKHVEMILSCLLIFHKDPSTVHHAHQHGSSLHNHPSMFMHKGETLQPQSLTSRAPALNKRPIELCFTRGGGRVGGCSPGTRAASDRALIKGCETQPVTGKGEGMGGARSRG